MISPLVEQQFSWQFGESIWVFTNTISVQCMLVYIFPELSEDLIEFKDEKDLWQKLRNRRSLVGSVLTF